MSGRSHVIAVPFQAQGHVAPLMKFAYSLSSHGIDVTFVNTESVHLKIQAIFPDRKFAEQCPIRLVSIPDGPREQNSLEDMERAPEFLKVYLQNLIENINQENSDLRVTHVISDITNGWALEVAKTMCIKAVAFITCGVGNLAFMLHVPKLIEDGIIDADGLPIKEDFIYLSKDVPPWLFSELLWSVPGDPEGQKFTFRFFVKNIPEHIKIADSIVVNSFYELEPSACDLIPNILPIGPLSANAKLGPFPGNFWPEDSTCLTWLDQKPPGSVIFAAFGSTVVCDQQQLNEIALGLEMTGQPFLWVIRTDSVEGEEQQFPDGYINRIEKQGKIIKWAPQEKVLAHSSIACFFSHCGWNSTMEGVSSGVPFLCWPYIVDQLHNRDYICKGWKIGLAVIPDDNGVVSRHEIRDKIKELMRDDDIKANSLKLKEMAGKSISEGGSSFKSFKSFVEYIKQ